MTQCRFLDEAEFRKAENARYELAKRRGNDPRWLIANNSTYGYASLNEITGPCVMWFATWYFNPANPEHTIRRETALRAITEGHFGKGECNYYLSRFYWQNWSDKRPPICVMCPNGAEWCVDSKSSNGEGWKVIGDPPLLCCTPSIQAPGYHGYLGSNGVPPGVFTSPLP